MINEILKELKKQSNEIASLREEYEQFRMTINDMLSRKKSHCVKGHVFTPDTIRYKKQNNKLYKICTICEKEYYANRSKK